MEERKGNPVLSLSASCLAATGSSGAGEKGAVAPTPAANSFQIFHLLHRLSLGLCRFPRSFYASAVQCLQRGNGALKRSRVTPRAPFCQLLLLLYFKSCRNFSLCSTWSWTLPKNVMSYLFSRLEQKSTRVPLSIAYRAHFMSTNSAFFFLKPLGMFPHCSY